MKNVFAKILVLVLCLTFVISGLASCKTDDQIADLQNQVNQNKNDDKADAAALEELKTLVEQIKNTADSAATAAALQEVVDNLAAVKNTADAAATAAKLTEVETALKALVETNGANDATVKADLEAAIAAVKATAEAAATKAAFDAAVAELQNTIATEKAAFVAELATINASIATGKTERDAIVAAAEALATKVDANKTAVDTAIAGVQATIDANKTALEDAIADVEAAAATKTELADAITALKNATEADLEAAVEALENKVEKVEADAATKAALAEAIDGVKKTAAENKAELDKAVADLTEAAATKTALADAVTELTTKIEKVEADAATKAALEAAVATINGKIADEKAALEAAINVVKTTADAAATKAALEAAVAANNTALATEVGKLEAKIAETTAAIAAAKAEVKAELEGKITALETKVADDIAALAAAAATKAELAEAIKAVNATVATAATKAELEVAVANLTSLINANAAEIAKNAAAIATNTTAIETAKTEVAATIAALETKVAGDIDTAVAAVKTELEGKITALETKVNNAIASFTEQITALQGADASLAETLATLQKQVADLEAAFDEQHTDDNNFAANFVNATKVLSGEAKIVVKLDMDGNVEKVLVVDKDSNIGDLYSIAAFDAITVDERFYVPADYSAFLAKKENLKFFLNRAISPEAIVEYFRQLYTYISEMPDFNETLEKLLAEKTTVTTAEDDLAPINLVVAQMAAQGAEMTPENKKAYDALVAAHNNLLAAVKAADDVETVIANIGYVVYTRSEALVEAAEAAVEAFKTEYFMNEAYNKYYTDNETTVVDNYTVLTTARDRYDELVLANANKITVIETALTFNAVRPLWTDKTALDANLAEFKTWCETYNIDEKADAESILTIYPVDNEVNPVDSLKVATLYADAMYGIYTNTVFAEGVVGVEALNNAVAALMAANETVLYTDYATAKAFEKNYIALDAAIKFNKQYDANVEDNNYAEMTKAIAEDFAKYMERQEALDATNTALDGYYTIITNQFVAADGKYKVTFNDWTAIELYGKNIASVIEDVDVVVGDANYVAFAAEKDPFALQADLVNEYLALTAKVREIYETVKALLGNSDAMSLAFGNNITEFLDEITNIMALGVTNIDLPLPGKDEADNANLADLMADLETVIDQFTAKADAAQAAAVDVAAAIATLRDFDTDNLNDYASIAAVQATLDAWVAKYLAADVALNNGDVAKAIKSVAEVQVYLAPNGTYYAYVTYSDYNKCVKYMEKAQAKYDAAEAAWAVVTAELERLTALEWNIHDKAAFEAADKAYNDYVKVYYTTTGITIADGVFGELAVYAAFVTERDACYAMAAEAVGAANVIKSLIESLAPAITESNYAAQLEIIAEINEKLEAYKAYCGEICDTCIAEALRITLAEKEALAKIYEYAVAAKAITNDKTDAEIDKAVALYSGIVLAANNGTRDFAEVISTITYTYESAKSAIDKKAPCIVDEDAHKDADDHKCDYCDKKITECAVTELNNAHECTVCGATSECVVEDGTAHECTICGDSTECVVEEGTAHECTICGATSECADEDADEACDVCGEPVLELQ